MCLGLSWVPAFNHREAVGAHTLGHRGVSGWETWVHLSRPSPGRLRLHPFYSLTWDSPPLSHRLPPATRPLHCTAPGSATHNCECYAVTLSTMAPFPLIHSPAKEGRKGFTQPQSWTDWWLGPKGCVACVAARQRCSGPDHLLFCHYSEPWLLTNTISPQAPGFIIAKVNMASESTGLDSNSDSTPYQLGKFLITLSFPCCEMGVMITSVLTSLSYYEN